MGRRRNGLLAIALLFLACAPAIPSAMESAVPSFFDSTEVRSDNMKPFKKWMGAVERYAREKEAAKNIAGNCQSSQFNRCHYEQWVRFLQSVKDKTKREQIRAVNDFMNKARYITDPVNWGKKDFWATPGEFMAKFGDCEDYAIAKFMSLKMLGFSEDDMRIAAVKDMNLKVGHAILIVFIDGKTLVLDNQIALVVEARRIHHYRPVFSLNTKSWWRHRT